MTGISILHQRKNWHAAPTTSCAQQWQQHLYPCFRRNRAGKEATGAACRFRFNNERAIDFVLAGGRKGRVRSYEFHAKANSSRSTNDFSKQGLPPADRGGAFDFDKTAG